MSWDIVLFSSGQKITSLDDLDEAQLIPIDFCAVFQHHFKNIKEMDNHRSVEGIDFSIEYFLDDDLVSNKMVSLYGKNGLYALVVLSKQHGLQIFDTSLGKMIDLDNPGINGYENFQSYLRFVLKSDSWIQQIWKFALSECTFSNQILFKGVAGNCNLAAANTGLMQPGPKLQ
jgi:hypothetical protein